MKTTINCVVLNSTLVGNVKTNEDGSVKLNGKGNAGYYVNGKVSHVIGDTLPSSIAVAIEGAAMVANIKTDDAGNVKFSESGNIGWRVNGKVTIEGETYQVGGDITVCKCMGSMPVAGSVVNLQVGINVTCYVSAKAAPVVAKATKGSKKQTVAANAAPATSVSTMTDMDLLEMVRKMLASK